MLRKTNSINTEQNFVNVPSGFTVLTNSNNVTSFESAYAGYNNSSDGYIRVGSPTTGSYQIPARYPSSGGSGTNISHGEDSKQKADEFGRELQTFYTDSIEKYKKFIESLKAEWEGDAADIYFSRIDQLMKLYDEERDQCMKLVDVVKGGIQQLEDSTRDATTVIGSLPGGN